MNTAKPFTDNLALLDQHKDPIQWNLNTGLQDLARQIDRIHMLQQIESQELKDIRDAVKGLLSRE